MLLNLVAGTSALLMLAACNMSPTSPSSASSDFERRVWDQVIVDMGKGNLDGFPFDPLIPPEALLRIPISDFSFQHMQGEFKCGGAAAVGCFTPDSGRIRYYGEGSLRHEIAHATLWWLNDERWGCVMHDSDRNQVWDCYE